MDGVQLIDQKVFAGIWETNRESLYWLAFRILDHQQEAQDVVTESFVKLYHSSNVFVNAGAVAGWLRVTVRNGALKLLEKNEMRKHRLGEFATLFNDIETKWYQEDVLAGVLTLLYKEIEALPAKSREVFKLRYLHQRTNEQIADELGIEYQSVRNHLVRALKRLRLSLGQYSHLLGVLLLMLGHRD